MHVTRSTFIAIAPLSLHIPTLSRITPVNLSHPPSVSSRDMSYFLLLSDRRKWNALSAVCRPSPTSQDLLFLSVFPLSFLQQTYPNSITLHLPRHYPPQVRPIPVLRCPQSVFTSDAISRIPLTEPCFSPLSILRSFLSYTIARPLANDPPRHSGSFVARDISLHNFCPSFVLCSFWKPSPCLHVNAISTSLPRLPSRILYS